MIKIKKSKFLAGWLLIVDKPTRDGPCDELIALTNKELVDLYLALFKLISENSKLKEMIPIQ